MPRMRNMFNQQSYKTFTPEFVPSTIACGADTPVRRFWPGISSRL